jgi:hypothetical protein
MEKYINDKSPFWQSIGELDGVMLDFEGHDRPRYIYPTNKEAGYLGIESFDAVWNTPQYVSTASGGTLESAKYYAIIVVPIKTDMTAGGLPIYGEASPRSIPVTPGSASKKLTFTIPTHSQKIIKNTGLCLIKTGVSVTDTSQAWTVNEHAGRVLKNVETGLEYVIVSNTADTVVCSNLSFTTGDRFQILASAITARAIYASEMTNATDVTSSTYYLRDIIEDNTTTSYELTAFAESADSWDFSGNYLPPPNAAAVKVLASLVFCGGGIEESRGTAKIDTTTDNSIQTATDDTGTVGAISKFEDSSKAWTPNELIGLTLINSANGEETITDNTATEVYPALIGSTKFNEADAYTVIDKTATPDVSEDAIFIPSTTKITFADTSAPEETGTVQGKTANTITFADVTGTPLLTKTIALASSSSLSVVNTASPFLTAAAYTGYSAPISYFARGFTLYGYVYTIAIGDYVLNSSNVVVAKVVGYVNAGLSPGLCYVGIDRAITLAAGQTVKFCHKSESWGTTQYVGKLLYNSSNFLIARITAHTDDTLYVQSSLAVGASFKVFSDTWTVDEWKDSVLHDGASVFGIVESNTVDTLTVTAHGLSVTDAFEITKGGWDLSEYAGKFVLDGAGTLLGKVLSNTRNTLTLNAAHGLTAGDAFDIQTAVHSGVVTFPTSFKVAGKTWTDNEHVGKTIIFSSANTKTILDNNADSIALSDTYMPASAETFSIISASMAVTNPYDFVNEDGATVKVARYTIFGDIAGEDRLPLGTYAGDYVTVAASGTAGNNITDVKILRVDIGGKWFEVENDSVSAGNVSTGATVTIARNHITGNISGADQTYFTEGLVDARAKFAQSGEMVFKITFVDPVNQVLGIDQRYTDPVTAYTPFEIISNYPLYYSQSRNPHAFGAGSIIDLYDITGFSTVGNSLLVFCKNGLYRVDVESLGATPVLISDNLRCPAIGAIVRGEKNTMFYDGTGFSITDGSTAQSVTAYKARYYLENINKEYEKNICGVYDRENKRFEFYFPMGTDTQNNYGLIITEDALNCYPVYRQDCNSLWTNYDQGTLSVFHGTTGELDDGIGRIWKHTGTTDGTAVSSDTIVSVDGSTIYVTQPPVVAVGDMITVYPIASGEKYQQMIVKSVSGLSITVDDSYDLSNYIAGDLVLSGYVLFDYGIKWTDFASPQYRHQVRALHIDISETSGKLYIDHFLDMSETPVATNVYDITIDDSKIVVPFRMGKSYKYGFRLRGYSSTGLKISSFEIMYDTQV